MSYHYRPGAALAICGPRLAVLVDRAADDPLVLKLVDLVDDPAAGADEALELLVSPGLRAITDFAVAEFAPVARVVVRGRLTARFDDADPIVGAGLWSDRMAAAARVALADPQVGEEGEVLPLRHGVVRAGFLVHDAGGAAPAQAPAPTVARDGSSSAEAPASAPASAGFPERVDESAAPDEPAVQPVAAEPPVAAGPTDEVGHQEVTDEAPSGEPVEEPPAPAVNPWQDEASLATPVAPADDHPFDPWAEDADAVPPAPAPAEPVADPVDPGTPAGAGSEDGTPDELASATDQPIDPDEPDGSDDLGASGETLEADEPADSHEPDEPGDSHEPDEPAESGQPDAHDEATTPESRWVPVERPDLAEPEPIPHGHTLPSMLVPPPIAPPPPAPAAEPDAATEVMPSQPVVRGVLRLSSGEVVALDRPCVIGRNPRIPDGYHGEDPRLVRVFDPGKDVSSQHLFVGVNGPQLSIMDLGSTNGTEVVLPGGHIVPLQPGRAVAIEPGAVVVLAGVLRIVVEPAR